MKRTYTFGQRLIAHVLLWSFLLQSCYNAPAPLPHLSKAERQEISKKLPRTIRGTIHSQEEALSPSQAVDVNIQNTVGSEEAPTKRLASVRRSIWTCVE